MTLHINNVGTWKPCTVWINNVGTWKKCAVWLNVSGVWKQITTLIGASLPANIYPDESYTASASLFVANTGGWTASGTGGSGTWMQGGSGSDYQARMTQTAGSSITGEALSTWVSLSATRAWYLTSATFDKSATATLEIRMAASPNTVLATSTVNFYCYGIL